MSPPRAKKSKGLSKPRTTCPFTGGALAFVETSSGWQARGPGWVSTKFYQTEEQAAWAFSHNNGEEPQYQPTWRRIQVIGEREEPVTSPEDVVASQEKVIENVADSFEKDAAAAKKQS